MKSTSSTQKLTISLEELSVTLGENQTNLIAGGDNNDIWTTTFIAGAAAGGYLWDGIKENFLKLPSSVNYLFNTTVDIGRWSANNSDPLPSGLTIAPFPFF